MSFYDAFRGFFGFPGHRRPRDPLFGGSIWDEEEEEEDEGISQTPQDFFDFSFSAPGGSRGAFQELFRDMSELLGVFGGTWAGPPRPFDPSLPGPGEGRPLRDSMLKQPDTEEPARPWRPFPGVGE
ncbi:HAX1 protein, partial [Turnix velox]|nr:HAX1 protein [Turnix velox]